MSDTKKGMVLGEEVLALFSRGAEFTKELLQENERLRREMVRFQDAQSSAAKDPVEWKKLRVELVDRINSLEAEYASVRERLEEVEEENSHFAERYIEIEEENNNLANLYVASYQLHSTLDLDEVLKIVMEIAINLIGAETFAIYTFDDQSGALGVVAWEGAEVSRFPQFELGEGPMADALRKGESVFAPDMANLHPDEPIVCVPLIVQDNPIGGIAIFSVFDQKDGFTVLDRELFALLGGHAATALFASRLYSMSERKLNTIQGFIDLLTD